MPSALVSALKRLLPVKLVQSKLLQQSSFYLLGQLLQKAVSFLLIPVWTIYLTPSDYGIMGTLTAYGGILHILLMFGIYGAVTRHYFDFKDDSETQRSYVSSNFLFLAVVPGIILTGLLLFGRPLWARVTSNSIPFQPYVVLMLVSTYGGLLTRLPYSLYQAQQKAHKCIALDFGTFVLSIGVSLVLVVGYRQGAYGMMMGGCIAQIAIVLITTGMLLREWFVPAIQWSHIKSTLAFGLPIVPHLLSGWALTFVDRVMLERMVPLDEVGRYTLGYNLAMIMLMIVTSINEAYQPYYYNLMSASLNPQPKISRIVSLYLAGLGFITLIGSIFAGELVALLTPARYHASARFVPPVLLGYLMVGLYYFVSSPIFFHKKTRVLPIITGISAVFNIVLNYLLIPKLGAVAAAWNTLGCYAIMLVLYYIVAQKISPFPYPVWRTLLVLGFLLAAIIVSGSLAVFTPASWGIKFSIVGIYLFVAYFLFLKPLRSANILLGMSAS